jgi:hypothetical protein
MGSQGNHLFLLTLATGVSQISFFPLTYVVFNFFINIDRKSVRFSLCSRYLTEWNHKRPSFKVSICFYARVAENKLRFTKTLVCVFCFWRDSP